MKAYPDMSSLPLSLVSSVVLAPHGFFTRIGGVSTGPFASLNCSLSGQDDRAAVLENRARAARAIGAEPDGLVGLTQVHGPDVVRVETAWAAGAGPRALQLAAGTALQWLMYEKGKEAIREATRVIEDEERWV